MSSRYLSPEFSATVNRMLKVDSENCTQTEKDLKDYIRLVLAIAKPYVRSRVEMEDLVMCGVMGLLEARKSYDPSRSDNFKSYASMRIMGEIFSYCQKNARLAHVQTHISKAAIYVEKIYKYIEAGGCENLTTYDIDEIALNFYCKKAELLANHIQEEVAYAKDRIKNIADNSSLTYEYLTTMARTALVTTVPETVLENHSDNRSSVEDSVSKKEVREHLKKTLRKKTYRTLELSVQGYKNTEIAKILHEEGLTTKDKPVSRAAIKSLKDNAIAAMRNMRIFSEED